MSIDLALARIAELRGVLDPAARVPSAPAPSAVTAAPSAFAAVLGSATAGGPVGDRIVAAARAEVGQAEWPPGSNDSPRIATYRTATAGSTVAPWCGYFVSWLARQAGTAIGDRGEGLGSVDAIWAWAQRTGRALPPSAQPAPGDLVVWDEHVGIVEQVLADGSVGTIEGNSSDAVSRRVHPPGSALGYVRLG